MKVVFFLVFVLIMFTSNVSNSQIQISDSVSRISKEYHLTHHNKQPTPIEKLNNDTLPIIKGPTLINSHSGDYGADQMDLSVAMDSSGNYLCVWEDLRDGYINLYAQLYDKLDRKIGNNFIINKDKIWGNITPIVSSNKRGDFVVVWENNLREVYARRINNRGQFLSEPIRLNSVNQLNTFPISVAIAENGSFIVVWTIETNYLQPWLYAVVVDPNNNVSDQIIIDEMNSINTSTIKARRATVAGDYFLVVFPSFNGKVYCQKVSMNGERIGGNFLINEMSYSYSSYEVCISSLISGNSLILWKTNKLLGRIYNPLSGFLTNEFVVSDTVGYFYVFTDKDSVFYLLYSVNYVDYFQKINKNGMNISDRIRVDYDSLSSYYQFITDVSDLGNNSFIIGKSAYTRSDLNCFIQKFNSDFQRLTSEQKIHDDLYSSWQLFPKVKFNSQGRALIIWEDHRNGGRDLYGRVIDENLEPVGDDFQINETSANSFFIYEKAICSFSDGTFVVAFWGNEIDSYQRKLILQLISSNGEKIGNNKEVTYSYQYTHYGIAMNINQRDELLLCWYSYFQTFTQLFDKNLNSLSGAKVILSASNNIGFNPLKISIDENHILFAVWRDYSINDNYTYPALKGRFFNYRPISDVFVIDSAANDFFQLDCANDSNKNFTVLYSSINQIITKRYYDFPSQNIFTDKYFTFNPKDIKIINFKNKKTLIIFRKNFGGLVQLSYFNYNKSIVSNYFIQQLYDYIYPRYYDFNKPLFDTVILQNKFLISYTEAMPQKGTDIFIKVLDGSNFNFQKEVFYSKTKTDFLYNNFPNPFNYRTIIPYQILSFSKVKLSVYDILGNLVKVLVDEYQQPRIYEVDFNAGELSSGVYFYKLEAFNTITKKMVILK